MAILVVIAALLGNSFNNIAVAVVVGGLIGLIGAGVIDYVRRFRKDVGAIRYAEQVQVVLIARSSDGASEQKMILLDFDDDESVDAFLSATTGPDKAEVVAVRPVPIPGPVPRAEVNERLIAAR